VSYADARQQQIATAALGVFSRYGYRRASMDLIAQAAQLSRPAVYQYFKNKEEVFRAAGALLAEQITAAARAAGQTDQPAADRLYRVLAVKLELFSGTTEARFRAELFTEATDIAADVVSAFEDAYLAVVQAVLIECHAELDQLGTVMSAGDTAALLVDALAGIAQSRQDQQTLHARLRQLTELTTRGLTSHPQEQ